MKMGYMSLALFFFTLLFACENESASNSENPEKAEASLVESTKESPTFDIETQSDEQGTPHSIVSVMVGGKKLKISEVNVCEKMEKEDYTNYQIPSSAIEACGGWWAGTGDYFYIIEDKNNTYTIMQASIDEASSNNGYSYQMVMKLANKPNPNN